MVTVSSITFVPPTVKPIARHVEPLTTIPPEVEMALVPLDPRLPYTTIPALAEPTARNTAMIAAAMAAANELRIVMK
jgi:hypothetical protein